MPVKIKSNLKDLKLLTKQVRKEFARRAPLRIKRVILRDILKGISPVKGAGKFRKYSKAYKKAIRRGHLPGKRLSPVNMVLSGQMLSDFFVKVVGGFSNGFQLSIGFANEVADFHNKQGAGKIKVIRRLIPDRTNEQFNRKITQKVISELNRAASKVAKKQS